MYLKPIGALLQKAGLVSTEQIDIALRKQTQSKKTPSKNQRLGEILASQGWIKQETANFFAEQWLTLLSKKSQQPLGQYLKKASLLNEAQIEAILSEQKRTGLRFGTLVALKGWIKQTTIDFFVESLSLTQESKFEQAPYIENRDTSNEQEDLKRIQEGLLENKQCAPIQLLKLYRQILQQGEVPANDTLEQAELLKLGLVIKQQNHLRVANRIYGKIFDLNWVETELAKMLPSSTSETKRNPNNSRISIVANESSPKKQKIRKINVRLLLLLLVIPGVLLVGFNLLFKARSAKNFQQGNELLNQGKYEQAIAKYDQVLNMDSKSYEAWTNRGYALAGLGEYSQMRESCSAAIEIEPKATYAWNCQGEALQNLNQAELALIVFDKAIAIDSNDPIFWINKSESLLSLKRFDEALEIIDQAIEKLDAIRQVDGIEQVKRELSVALSSKGRILGEKELYEQALAFYDQALEYAPDYFPAQRGRSITLKALGRYNEADTNFNAMLENPKLSDTQKAEIWFYKGLTLCEQRQPQAGVIAFEEALKLKPDYQAAKSAIVTCN